MKKTDLHCHYSGLPSPLAYIKEEKKRNETSHTKNNVLVEHGKTKKEK